RFRVSYPVDAELDGRGVDLGAVVEEDILLQLEGVEPAVGRDLPGLGGVADELAIGRDVDEAASEVHGDTHHFVALMRMEIEVRDLVAVGDAQGASAFRRLRLREARWNGDQPGECGDAEEKPR